MDNQEQNDFNTIQELRDLISRLGSTATISALNELSDRKYDFINALNVVNRKAEYLDSSVRTKEVA